MDFPAPTRKFRVKSGSPGICNSASLGSRRSLRSHDQGKELTKPQHHCSLLISRKRNDRQFLSNALEFRVSRDQPCATLNCQFSSEGISISQAMFLLEGASPSGPFLINSNYLDWELA